MVGYLFLTKEGDEKKRDCERHLCDSPCRWREATTGPPHPTRDSLRATHRLFARLGRRRDHQALTTMATSTASSLLLHAAPATHRHRHRRVAASAVRFDRRSAVLLLLSAAGAAPPANAAGIGLFGIRKKLERAEEAAAEAVRDVEEAAVEAAAVGGEAVKETVVAAGKEAREVAGEGLQLVAGAELAGDGLVQAGVVAGAEALGVVVGLSVVNGILRPEA